MSVIKAYKIDGANLQLEEYLYWTFTPDQQEAVQVWTLVDVDKADLDISKLDQLVAYQEDADYEQELIDGRIKLLIYTHFDKAEYVFHCNKLSTHKRPYNTQELTDFLVRYEELHQEQGATIIKQRQFIDELAKFVEHSIDRKSRIAEQFADSSNRSKVKAEYQLDILRELKAFFANSKVS